MFTILLIGHFIDIYSLKLHLIAGIYIKAVYNKVYKKTSFDIMDIFKQLAVGLHHGTVEGDQSRVRPFGTAHIFEGKLYIRTG